MKNNIKDTAMYIMAIIIIVLCNIAASILYFAAAIIRFCAKLIEAGINMAPIVIGAVAVFGKKLVKKFAAFFSKLFIKVKIYTSVIAKYAAKATYSVINTIREVINNADCIIGVVKNKANNIVEKTVTDVKETKKYINFKVDSIKARHGGNAVSIVTKKTNGTVDWIKNNVHEAIEFRRAIMAECR